MKLNTKKIIYLLLFLSGILSAPFTYAATEFVSVVDPGMGAGYDYDSLYDWEAATQTNLTLATTKVFSGTRTGTLTDNATMYLCRSGVYQTVTANRRHATATQILAQTISNGSFVFQSGDIWYTNNTCNSAAYFTVSDAGDSAINVAKCRTSDGTADTTPIIINGFTTSATNYIKIWTDPSEGYRHQGKWDDGKYNLSITGYDLPIYIQDNYVVLDGLQIKLTTSESYGYEYVVGINNPNGRISNNIIVGIDNYSNNFSGISYGDDTGGTSYFWNNIIYEGGANGLDQGFIQEYNAYSYVYNNTVIGAGHGFDQGGYSERVFLKNNITQNCTDGYYGTFNSASDYNISDIVGDTTGVSASYRSGQATDVTFTNEGSSDFHLASNDAYAKNFGTNLSDDPDDGIDFATDIDSQSRPIPYGGAWDIGADEEGPKTVFYSVGQSTADLSNNASSQTCTVGGDCTVTISSGTATFNFSQTGNIGVGDRITYNVSSIMYIAGKISQTQWTVVTATGGAPGNVTGQALNSITREYTTLSAAEAGATDSNHLNAINLVTGNYQLNFPCYYDTGADTTAVTVDGYATGLANYIKIYTPNSTTTEVNTSQRHSGVWSAGKYRLEITANNGISVEENFVRIDGLQILITNSTAGVFGGISTYYLDDIGSSEIQVSNNIIRGVISGTIQYNSGIKFHGSSADVIMKAWNNVIYDFIRTADNTNIGIYINSAGDTLYAYNNTVYNCSQGINRDSSGTVVLKNNIAYNNTDNYVSIFSADSTNNLSGPGTDAQIPATNARDGYVVTFADEANDDFHLSSADTGATKHGANLSNDANLEFAVDIDNDARVGSWDIGADEASLSIAEVNSPDLWQNSITDGLVGYWPFDGPDVNMSTNTAYDRSPVGTNHGTISGATPVMGKKGQGMSFDGSSGYISIANDVNTYLNMTNGSISFWYKANGAASGDRLFRFVNNGDYFIVYFSGATSLRLLHRADYGAQPIIDTVVPNITTDNDWHNVVVTWDVNGGSETMAITLDGVRHTDNDVLTAPVAYSGTGYIGGDIDTPTNAFNGRIDEFRIYNHVLSESEIGQLYRHGQEKINMSLTDKLTNGLVGMWSFDGPDVSGATAYDRSPIGTNHGTISGATPVMGKKGQGLGFDGATSYINAGSGSSLDDIETQGGGGMTVSAWIKPETVGEGGTGIIACKRGTNAEGSWAFYTRSGTPQIAFYKDGSTDLQANSSNNSISLFQWQYVAVTWNGGNDASEDVNLYVNGIEVGHSWDSDMASKASDVINNLYIGADVWGAGTFDGKMDEARLYNRVLSPVEIFDLYNLGKVDISQ
ncbi:MAG: Cell wall/surface repeat protein [Patescibacteria group bacterium]|nr:Cell wall/surface repeat protein [Patescibacteria group bacterium]